MVQELTIINKSNGSQALLTRDGSTNYVIDYIDWDEPKVDFTSHKVPYQIGETLSSVEIGTRQPVIMGYVISKISGKGFLGRPWDEYINAQLEDIEERKGEINKVVSPLQDVRILIGNYFIDARPSSPVIFGSEETENNEVLCKFTINLICFSSMFQLDRGKRVVLAQIYQKFRFPWVLKKTGNLMGVVSTQKLVEVVNEGDCDIGGIITLKSIGGVVVNPVIFNASTQERFETSITLEDGDYLIINTKIGEESVIFHDSNYFSSGVSKDIDVIADVSEESVFFQFRQGVSLYGYSVDSGETFVELDIEMVEQFFNIREI